MEVEPYIKARAPTLGNDPPDPAPPFRGAAGADRIERIGQGKAAAVARSTGDFLSSRHAIGDCLVAAAWAYGRSSHAMWVPGTTAEASLDALEAELRGLIRAHPGTRSNRHDVADETP
jgi:hypothetical protein